MIHFANHARNKTYKTSLSLWFPIGENCCKTKKRRHSIGRKWRITSLSANGMSSFFLRASTSTPRGCERPWYYIRNNVCDVSSTSILCNFFDVTRLQYVFLISHYLVTLNLNRVLWLSGWLIVTCHWSLRHWSYHWNRFQNSYHF